MTTPWRAMALSALVLIVLTACVPFAPVYVPVVTEEPSTPAPGESSDPSPGFIDIDELRDALATLEPEGDAEWSGGRAVTIAGNAQSGIEWVVSKPKPCSIFVNAALLIFAGDIENGVQDPVVSIALIDRQGPGPDDDEWLANVTIRLLSDDTDAATEVIQPINAAVPKCSEYVTHTTSNGWLIEDVSQTEVILDSGVSFASASVTIRSVDALDGPDPTVTVWARVGNAVIVVTGGRYVDPVEGSGAVEPTSALASEIAEILHAID